MVAPAITFRDPDVDDIDQSRVTLLQFQITGPDGVESDSIQATVDLGAGVRDAIVDSALQYPFEGTGSGISAIAGGYDCVLAFRGIFRPEQAIQLAVEAKDTLGNSMPTDSWEFTTAGTPLAGIPQIQIAKAS